MPRYSSLLAVLVTAIGAARGTAQPRPLSSNPLPEYPPLWAEAEVGDSFDVRLNIDSTGVVSGGVPQPTAGAVERSLATLSEWRFVPARLAGRAVAGTYDIRVIFSTADSARPGVARTLQDRPIVSRGSINALTIRLPVPGHGVTFTRTLGSLADETRDSVLVSVYRVVVPESGAAGQTRCIGRYSSIRGWSANRGSEWLSQLQRDRPDLQAVDQCGDTNFDR